MPTGIRPRVNEAREFLEIAKDFKDPKEIIREALSNLGMRELQRLLSNLT